MADMPQTFDDEASIEVADGDEAHSRKKRLRLPLLLAAPVVLLVGAVAFYLHGGRYQSTDNAYVQSGLVSITPSVSGHVISMNVHENQVVRKGDILFRIDPGRFETGLCPLSDFDRNPIYPPGREPDDAEIAARRERYWRPYHDRLRAALDAAKARHGFALLIDAHSIRPRIPSLFDGALPDLNFGTDSGRTLPPRLTEALNGWRAAQARWSHVLDGRFTGGYTTRHYGQPRDGIFALQIEIVQDAYLDLTSPRLYDAAIARPLSLALRALTETLLAAL